MKSKSFSTISLILQRVLLHTHIHTLTHTHSLDTHSLHWETHRQGRPLPTHSFPSFDQLSLPAQTNWKLGTKVTGGHHRWSDGSRVFQFHWLHTHTQTSNYTRVRAHTLTFTHPLPYTHTHTHTHNTHTHTHTHTPTHTPTHTHTIFSRKNFVNETFFDLVRERARERERKRDRKRERERERERERVRDR